MYRCSKLVYIDAQRDETDLAGGQNFTRITAGHTHYITGHFCGNKNLPPYKMSGRSKVDDDDDQLYFSTLISFNIR